SSSRPSRSSPTAVGCSPAAPRSASSARPCWSPAPWSAERVADLGLDAGEQPVEACLERLRLDPEAQLLLAAELGEVGVLAARRLGGDVGVDLGGARAVGRDGGAGCVG